MFPRHESGKSIQQAENASWKRCPDRQAATNPCTPNAAARPAASVTAKAASTSQPQASAPMPNPSAVRPAPISAKTATRDARCP